MNQGEPDDPDSEEPDAALERWRARLAKPSAKAASGTASPSRVERPRTVQEAAEELGLSIHTIRSWVASRKLGHLRLGRAIRIPAAEIRRVIDESTVPAVRED